MIGATSPQNSGEQKMLEASLHQLRKDIDANIKATKAYKPEAGQTISENMRIIQREIEIAYTKLQEAKMWVGKCLEAINSPFPEELRDEAPQNG